MDPSAENPLGMSPSSAIAAIKKLTQTAGILGKQISRPSVPEHRTSVEARVHAASESQSSVPYSPYISFKARRRQNPSALSSGSLPSTEQNNSSDHVVPPTHEDPPPSDVSPGSPGVDASDTDYQSAISRPSSRGRGRAPRDLNAGRARNPRSISPRQRPETRSFQGANILVSAIADENSLSHLLEDAVRSSLPSPVTSQMDEDSPQDLQSVTPGMSTAPINRDLIPTPLVPPPVPQGCISPFDGAPASPRGGIAPMDEDSTSPPISPSAQGNHDQDSAVLTLPSAGTRDSTLSNLATPTVAFLRNHRSPSGPTPSPSVPTAPMDQDSPPLAPPSARPAPSNSVAPSRSHPSSSRPVPLPFALAASMDQDPPSLAPLSTRPILSNSVTPSRNHPSPSRPVPLPPIPTAMADVIGRAVAEHLASELVEPTVRNVIDACVPRIVDILETRFTTSKPSTSTKGGKYRKATNQTSDLSGDCGSDGDNEDDDEVVPPPRRKKPGPRGKMNRLHNKFRLYLRSKKVIPTSSKGELPASAPDLTVQAFNQNGESPPVLESIALDWASHPLSASRWNREVIALLSSDFHTNLVTGLYKDVTYDQTTMNLPAIRRLCEQKLVRTHQAHRKEAQIRNSAAEERQQILDAFHAKEQRRLKSERRISRCYGTFARRKRIITENCFRDPQKWNDVEHIITQLGVEGMSGDETDSTPTWKSKTVRRLEPIWLNPDISHLFRSVESYEAAVRTESMREQVGNVSLERHWEPRNKDTKSKPIAGLPRNWYNNDWFQGLNSGARSLLIAQKERPIPLLDPYER